MGIYDVTPLGCRFQPESGLQCETDALDFDRNSQGSKQSCVGCRKGQGHTENQYIHFIYWENPPGAPLFVLVWRPLDVVAPSAQPSRWNPTCHLSSVTRTWWHWETCEMEFRMLPKEKEGPVCCFTHTRQAAHHPLGCKMTLLRWQQNRFSFFKKPCLSVGRIILKIADWFSHVAQTWNNFTQFLLHNYKEILSYSAVCHGGSAN